MSKKRITTKEAQLKLDTRYPNKYLILSEYTGKDMPLKIKHIECGGIFNSTYHSIYSGNQICPCCKTKRFLNNHGYSLDGYKEKFKKRPKT